MVHLIIRLQPAQRTMGAALLECGLALEAGRAVTLEAMEGRVIEDGRELLRGVVQLSVDAQAEREIRLPEVTGADGVPRRLAERGHARTVVTRLGKVAVRRIGYRARIRGVPSLFPRDAVLNLPPCGYSWPLQRLAEVAARSVSFGQAREFVLAATGVSIGKRSWSRSPWRRPRTWSGSARTGVGPPSRRPGCCCSKSRRRRCRW
jgi:hypothetical protein